MSNFWKPVEWKPERPGWYATVSTDAPSITVPRYFDDAAPDNANWFIARSNGGSDSIHGDNEPPLVVNMSFDMWTELPTLEK